MVTVAFGIATAGIAASAASAGAIGTLGLIAAGGMLAAYIDQAVIYPEIFGKRNPRPASLEGFQISTTDPGAPRWEVFGSRAWVPLHYLWSLNVREEVSGNGQVGKGGRPFTQVVRADVGLATCDGPIVSIDTLYADERPFWSRQFNRVVLEDNRWSIYPEVVSGSPTGFLTILATDAEVTDFAGILKVGDIVRLRGVSPASLNGYYRVAAVVAHAGAVRSAIALQPLQGQTPANGVAGSIFQPAELRRIDQGAASSQWVAGTAGSQLTTQRPTSDPTIPGLPAQREDDLQKIWVIGGVYRFTGWSPSTIDGLYRLATRGAPLGSSSPADDYTLYWDALESQPVGSVVGPGSPSLPGIIARDDSVGSAASQGRNFVFLDVTQEWAEYPGTLDQLQDPALSAIEPNPPAHRGIAHISLKNWNLGPHSNVFPRVVGLVRSRNGETVAQAIDRICRRTMPVGHVDVSKLRTKALLGYAVPGGMTSGEALQPIQTFHGIVSQDRGGVLTFLDERDLPVVAVATRHLNARPTSEQTTARGFVPKRIDEADIPERIVLHYIDPGEGENEAEGDGVRAPGSADRGRRDTPPINLRPMVIWPHEAKRRARELRRRVQLETHRGQVRLPPGYMDVLPGHLLTFRANNWHEEVAEAAPLIAHDTQLRDLLPRSVRVDVRFAGGQVAQLVDNGNGALEGFPAGIAPVVNTVDYAGGEIQLLCDEALDDAVAPRISYLYDRQWLVRVGKATLTGYDCNVVCEVKKTTTDNPLPPVPRDLTIGLGGAIASAVPDYRVHLLDLPSIYPGTARSVWIGIVAAPSPGGPWRGGTVFESPNGVDRWTPIGQIQIPSVIGTVPVNNLPDRVSGAHPGVVDWKTELVVDLPGGETLDDATHEMIAQGINWLLVGDEIIAFHEAESAGGTEWTLRGLVRGLRHTEAAMETQADGARVVLLTNIGALHGMMHEPIGGLGAANRTYHLRIVPAGASIDQVRTISQLVTGRSALPAAPQVEAWMLSQKVGGYVQLAEWGRRGIDQTTVFGPSPMQAGEFERYQVVAFDILTAAGLIATLGVDGAIAATAKQTWTIGSESLGSPQVEKLVQYEEADFLAHGFVLDVTPIGFVVYQVGPFGRSPRSEIAFITPAS